MKKVLYIIPGWEDNGNEPPYQRVAKIAEAKGYAVSKVSVNWKEPLSRQLFSVTEETVIFGFSLGAILARLVSQKYPCEHLILASMTPDHNFANSEIRRALVDLAGSAFIDDITQHLTPHNLAKRQTLIYGDLEDEKADILIPNTNHELTSEYVQEIEKLL